jgi:Dyp-type peroxidase family
MATELERLDIQGIVLSAYAHLPCAAYQLLRITDARAARGWLAKMAEKVTDARGKKGTYNHNVALTATGLRNLGLDEETIARFAWPFRDGMISEHRQRILGDTDVNAPQQWEWGNDQVPVDILLMIFAEDETTLASELLETQKYIAEGIGVQLVKALTAGRQPDTKEHFGFNDGIAQPVIEGSHRKQHELERIGVAEVIKQGEVLLGLEDDYGGPSPSPTVAAARDPKKLLRDGQNGQRDLGYNGTYLVFRQMEQDVPAFWNFVDQAHTDSTKLASKLVGRWPSGAPLVKYPDADPHAHDGTLSKDDDFDYQSDTAGVRCPIGSHIRRTNPRDTLGPDPKAAVKSANRHRLLRRGRSYGHRITDPRTADGKERGLHFICVGSDIARQFEFVQQQWVNNTVFGGLYSEVDPLVGDQSRGQGTFTVPGDPLRTRVPNLCRFTKIRGGAYFFLPSLRAIRYLASL